jgi:caffeoyl-CoA O-methyltransferase
MQIAADQGTFLGLLVAAMGARRAVEVGTFTGYSAICIARALGAGGRLLCCDVSEEWTGVARRYWAKAQLEDRIELRLAPAAETLRALPREGQFDFAFIDADKPGYLTYYEEILPRLRPGGLLAVDNVLWSGEIVDASNTDENTRALRAFNDHVAADRRVQSVILAIADGLTLARKL